MIMTKCKKKKPITAKSSPKRFKHVSTLLYVNSSGFNPPKRKIETAKKHAYYIIKDIGITGDAPKDIVRKYEYGKSLKKNHKAWPIYIAKFGSKYYPMESITEQLLTDIGLAYGFDMASSKICFMGGQVRFLSKFFFDHKKFQLYHGADMYTGYLNNDKEFVDKIEETRCTQDFFTVEFTKEVLGCFFQEELDSIYRSFMRMLFLDALLGNNDRHMYNWGVITDISGGKTPYFSPIYDTARGLLWNLTELQICERLADDKLLNKYIVKYCKDSKPKIGVEGEEKINHFDLIRKNKEYYKNDELVKKIFLDNIIDDVIGMIEENYKNLLSLNRKKMVVLILKHRFNEIRSILEW